MHDRSSGFTDGNVNSAGKTLHTALLFDIKNQKLQNQPPKQTKTNKQTTHLQTQKALLILLLRKKVTVAAGRQQPGCPNTSAASKEKKTRNWKNIQPVSGMANDNCSLYMETGHLGSHSLCCCPRNFSVKLWWLMTTARTARGCGSDGITASASRDCK